MLPPGGEKTGKDVLDGFFGTHSSISPTTPLGPPEEELPPLRVIDYAALVDRYCRECIYNKELQRRREEFIFAYPLLLLLVHAARPRPRAGTRRLVEGEVASLVLCNAQTRHT